MNIASVIANRLADKYDLKVKSTSEVCEMEDGVIEFHEFPNHHIQVGEDDLGVVRENSDGSFMFFEPAMLYTELFRDLHKKENGQ